MGDGLEAEPHGAVPSAVVSAAYFGCSLEAGFYSESTGEFVAESCEPAKAPLVVIGEGSASGEFGAVVSTCSFQIEDTRLGASLRERHTDAIVESIGGHIIACLAGEPAPDPQEAHDVFSKVAVIVVNASRETCVKAGIVQVIHEDDGTQGDVPWFLNLSPIELLRRRECERHQGERRNYENDCPPHGDTSLLC